MDRFRRVIPRIYERPANTTHALVQDGFIQADYKF